MFWGTLSSNPSDTQLYLLRFSQKSKMAAGAVILPFERDRKKEKVENLYICLTPRWHYLGALQTA